MRNCRAAPSRLDSTCGTDVARRVRFLGQDRCRKNTCSQRPCRQNAARLSLCHECSTAHTVARAPATTGRLARGQYRVTRAKAGRTPPHGRIVAGGSRSQCMTLSRLNDPGTGYSSPKIEDPSRSISAVSSVPASASSALMGSSSPPVVAPVVAGLGWVDFFATAGLRVSRRV